jgi:hypothetical protein
MTTYKSLSGKPARNSNKQLIAQHKILAILLGSGIPVISVTTLPSVNG